MLINNISNPKEDKNEKNKDFNYRFNKLPNNILDTSKFGEDVQI